MLVFWKQKLVLLAVPKTGTTALEAALLPHADAAILHPPQKKHTPARGYRNRLSGFFEDKGTRPMDLMAVIREPVDWLGSWYRYRTRPRIADMPTSTAGLTFDQFVESWLSDPVPEYARVGRQSRFVSNGRGDLLVDHLFAYEDMPRATAFLEERLALRIELPRLNQSPRADLHLSSELEARLRTEAAADFALWEKVRAHSAADQ